jgi:hypothetical protein
MSLDFQIRYCHGCRSESFFHRFRRRCTFCEDAQLQTKGFRRFKPLCAHCNVNRLHSARNWFCGPCASVRLVAQQWAVAQVATAIRNGLFQRADSRSCADCGKQAFGYDHRDYSKPLDIEPVCRSCNRRRGSAAPLSGEFLTEMVARRDVINAYHKAKWAAFDARSCATAHETA